MDFVKMPRWLRRGWIPLAFCCLFSSCFVKIRDIGLNKTMTISIANSFAGCHNPLSSSAFLPYKGTVIVKSVDNNGNNQITVDQKDWVSATNPGDPVAVTVNVPAKGYFVLVVTEKATKCSTCSPIQLKDWYCDHTIVSGGIKAAVPINEYQTGNMTYKPSYALGASGWFHYADPLSCGCTVPN